MAKVSQLDVRTVGDLAYPLQSVLIDAGGLVNLTNTSVLLELRRESDGTVKASRAMTVTGLGSVSYAWQAADVDEAGVFHVRIIVTFPGALPFHYPPNGYGELTFVPGTT